MLVTVRLFARFREIAGVNELQQELPAGATARTAWQALAARHPQLAEYETVASCAVNEEYARFSTTLNDGDEIAFLPPVSGGGCHLASGFSGKFYREPQYLPPEGRKPR
jgi:molybdopterin converting factor subunit 1